MHIRWIIRRDRPEVLDIEQRSFDQPWSDDDFTRALRQRNIIGLVAEVDEAIAGYVIYELGKRRLHILNLAVAPWMRRLKVGSALIDKLYGKLRKDGRHVLSLEVRESNLSAQLFFREMGFKAKTVLRNVYADSDEDAYYMERRYEDTLCPTTR